MADNRIAVSITAETGELLDELGDARAQLRAFGDEVQSLGDQMALSGTAGNAGLAAAAAGQQAMARQAMVSARQQAMAWHGALREIDSAEGSFVRTVFSRRQSLNQSLMQLSAQLVQREIAGDLEWLTNKLVLNALGLESDRGMEEGGLLAHLLSEEAKTTATVTGAAARTSANQAAASTSLLSELGHIFSFIVAEAAKTFAGVFGFLSGMMGPAAAAPAAASSASVLAAASSIPAFDAGAWEIPGTMLGVLHAGETILPQDFASGFRAAFGGDAGGGNVTFAPSVSAVDAKSVVALFNNPSIMRQFARNLSAYMALNPSTRGAY